MLGHEGKAIHEIATLMDRSYWYVRLVIEGDPCMKEQDSMRMTSTKRGQVIDDPEKIYQTIIGLQQKGVSLRSISKRCEKVAMLCTYGFDPARHIKMYAHKHYELCQLKVHGKAASLGKPL